MADKRISQLVDRGTVANNDVVPIVVSGATTTNKATISSIQTYMQGNLDLGVTSIGITLGSSGTDVSVSGSPITSSGNITINIPDASASARGVVTTGAQNFAGNKSFQNTLFANAGVRLDQNGTALPTFVQNISGTGLSTTGANGVGFNNTNNFFFAGSDKGCAVFEVNNTGTRNYTLQNASGTLAFTSDLTGYVTLDTTQTITAQKTFTTSGSSDTMIISHGSGSGFALDVIKAGNNEAIRVTKTSGSGNAMSISGGLLLTEGVSVNTPANAIGLLLNGRTSDNFSQIRFGANTGGGQYNSIGASSSSLDISSLGNTPITFSTDTQGSGGVRMTIAGNGAVTLTGALNGTSASFTGDVNTNRGNDRANIAFNTTAGVSRWGMGLINSETGSNVGGDFTLFRYNDNGTFNSFNLTMNRSTGAATFSSSVTAVNNVLINLGTPSTPSTGGTLWLTTNNNTTRAAAIQAVTPLDDNAHHLLFYTNPTFSTPVERMRITSSGNVGIGTPSPTTRLTVQGGYANFTDGTVNIYAGSDGNGGLFGTVSNHYQRFITNDTERMRITSGGNVGIGTPSPFANLQVLGTIKVATGNAQGILAIGEANGTTVNVGLWRGAANAPTTDGNFLNLGGFDGIVFAASNAAIGSQSERMRITSGGTLVVGNGGSIDSGGAAAGDIAVSANAQKIGYIPSSTSNRGYFEPYDGNGFVNIVSTFATAGIRFMTGNSATERMRITAGGYLKASNTGSYISTTTPYHELLNSNGDSRVVILTNSSATLTGQNGILVYFQNATPNNTTSSFIDCEDASTLRFSVKSNGNVVNTNNSYGAISDIKLKENIEDASPKLDDLMKVKVRNYNLIGDDKKQIGVIAQELEEVFPAMIDESEDFEEVEVPQVDEEGNEILNEEGKVVTENKRVSKGTTTKSVKYSVFVPMLIKAMQEQQEQIKVLTEQINSLKNQMQ